MAINVEFRGICLFVAQGANLERVLIPNAASDATPRDGTPRTPTSLALHADGSEARPHYAGLLVLDAQGTKICRVEPLHGTVTITEQVPRPRPCHIQTMGNTVALRRVANIPNVGKSHDLEVLPEGDSELDERAAAIIVLRGGTVKPSLLSPTSDSGLEWSLTTAFNKGHGFTKKRLTLRLAWESTAPSVTLEIEPQPDAMPDECDGGKITLTDGQRAYLYNVDDQTPSVLDLNKKDNGTTPTRPTDDDFRWFYQLVRTKDRRSLQDWMKEGDFPLGERPHLPAPKWDPPSTETQSAKPKQVEPPKAQPHHPDVSTCFPSSWP